MSETSVCGVLLHKICFMFEKIHDVEFHFVTKNLSELLSQESRLFGVVFQNFFSSSCHAISNEHNKHFLSPPPPILTQFGTPTRFYKKFLLTFVLRHVNL